MGESIIHKQYIDIIYNYCLNIVPNNHSKLILIDNDDNLLIREVPPIINGYRPDLFYEFNSLLIIGEAKTEKDYYTNHSLNQYKEYIKYCSHYGGDSYLIICCPWMCTGDIKNIIRKISKEYKNKINIIILDEISGEKKCKK